MAAACWGQIPVLELLAKSGADLDAKTKDNKTFIISEIYQSVGKIDDM